MSKDFEDAHIAHISFPVLEWVHYNNPLWSGAYEMPSGQFRWFEDGLWSECACTPSLAKFNYNKGMFFNGDGSIVWRGLAYPVPEIN